LDFIGDAQRPKVIPNKTKNPPEFSTIGLFTNKVIL
jgi:hypothetical protein